MAENDPYGPYGDDWDWKKKMFQQPKRQVVSALVNADDDPYGGGDTNGSGNGGVWTDPDNAMPPWLHDPNAPPSARPPAPQGKVWKFENGIWGLIDAPGATAVGNMGGEHGDSSIDRSAPTGGGGFGGFGGGGQGGGGGMLAFSPYHPYGPFNPRNPNFTFDPYKQSSWEDAENEPGYAASRTQLKKQVEQGAAYKGMVRSGMTIGDLYSNLDALSQSNFTNFDNRNFRNWSGNRDLAFGKWDREYGVDRDVYDRGATENDRFNNYRFNTEDASFKDILARWQEMTRSLTSIATPK